MHVPGVHPVQNSRASRHRGRIFNLRGRPAEGSTCRAVGGVDLENTMCFDVCMLYVSARNFQLCIIQNSLLAKSALMQPREDRLKFPC